MTSDKLSKFLAENSQSVPAPPVNEWDQIQRKISGVQSGFPRVSGRRPFWAAASAVTMVLLMSVIYFGSGVLLNQSGPPVQNRATPTLSGNAVDQEVLDFFKETSSGSSLDDEDDYFL